VRLPRLDSLVAHRGVDLSAYLLIVRVFVAFSFLPCFNRFVVFFFAMPILLSFSVAARRFTPFCSASAALPLALACFRYPQVPRQS